MVPDWRDEIISALEFWIASDGGAAGAPKQVTEGRVRSERLDALRIAGKGVRPEGGSLVLGHPSGSGLSMRQLRGFRLLAHHPQWN